MPYEPKKISAEHKFFIDRRLSTHGVIGLHELSELKMKSPVSLSAINKRSHPVSSYLGDLIDSGEYAYVLLPKTKSHSNYQGRGPSKLLRYIVKAEIANFVTAASLSNITGVAKKPPVQLALEKVRDQVMGGKAHITLHPSSKGVRILEEEGVIKGVRPKAYGHSKYHIEDPGTILRAFAAVNRAIRLQQETAGRKR